MTTENVSEDIKRAMQPVMVAFDTFKKSVDEQIAEVKKGIVDPVLAGRIEKIEKTMDDGIEAANKAAAAIAAEKKEREELELKLGRMNLSGHSEESAKREVEIKTFNLLLAGMAAERKQSFTPLDGAGYDAYRSAFDSFMRKNERMLTPEEVKTLAVGSDPDGGYFVTPDISGRIVRKVYETSPVRQNANVQTIGTDALEGIEDLGEAGAGYAGEQSQGSDTTTPQVGKWRIPVFWIDTEPKATQQLLDDANVDIEGWLGGKVSDKFGRFENNEFVTGSANRIRGFVNGYTTASDSGSGVTWGQIGYKATGVNSDFAASNPIDNLLDLMGLLKNDYLANAKWYTRRTVITKIRKFKDSTGQLLWQPAISQVAPEMLQSHPVVRMEDMPALANNSLSLAFGDLYQAYQIVDRQGIRVLRDPFTSKPYVKFYTTKRVGGGVVNFEAIKLMKFG
jgi:HK97 family phage major capsid protein